MYKSDKKDRDTRLALFNELNDKQVRALYDISSIQKLQPGDILFKAGDCDPSLYMILSGKVRIFLGQNGNTKPVETLGEGDYAGEMGRLNVMPHTTSAIVSEPSNILHIQNDKIAALDERTQLFFHRLLNSLALTRIKSLEAAQEELSQKNRILMDDLFYERTRTGGDLSQNEIIQGILTKIPKLPAFAGSLVTMLVDQRTTAEDLSEQIRNDPALVGCVMKTVNSPFYGLRQKVSDIHRAIVLLGFNEIYQLIVSEGVRQIMPNTPEFLDVHSHCVAVSRIAAILSKETHVGKPAEMATMGLLHDIGQLVIQLLKKQNAKLSLFLDGLDHSQMGALLLKSWNLPDIIWRSVEFQSYPEFSSPQKIDSDIRDNVILLYLSHLCLENLCENPIHKISRAFLEDYVRLINLDEFSVADITRVWVIPGLRRNMEALPVSLKNLLSKE
jgi:HD-like signal output (HDOD) protein